MCDQIGRRFWGPVLYTLLQGNLAARLEENCRVLGLPCLSILGPGGPIDPVTQVPAPLADAVA
jgi:hypothetical protein